MPKKYSIYFTKPVLEGMLECLAYLEKADRRLVTVNDDGRLSVRVITPDNGVSAYTGRAVYLLNRLFQGSTFEVIELLLEMRPDVIRKLKEIGASNPTVSS